MISAGNFSLAAVQTVVFTPDGMLAPSKLIAFVIKNFPDRYTGEIEALRLPDQIPPEVPRVVLQSEDGRCRLEAAPSRTNSYWRAGPEEIADLATIARSCGSVQASLVRENQLRIGRLALIVTRICRVENPAETLIRRFCSSETQREPFNRSETFEIHNHKKYCLRNGKLELMVNSWVRCKTASLTGDGAPAVLVEQDLNTLAEDLETQRFSDEQILAFLDAAARESDSIFSRYFPG